MWRPARLAENLAGEVLTRAGARPDDSRSVDVEAIATRKFGIWVQRNEMQEEGRFYVSYGNAIISLRQDRPVQRERFTLAHELGHWALSHSGFATVEHLEAAAPSEEIFCNLFAGALLMPRDRMERKFGDRLRDEREGLPLIVEIARHFKASLQAVTVRLRSAYAWKRTLLQWQRVNHHWLFEAEAGVFPWEEGLVTPGDVSFFISEAGDRSPRVYVTDQLPIMAPRSGDFVEAEMLVKGDGAAALIASLDVLQERHQRALALSA